MKYLFILFFSAILFISCKDDPVSPVDKTGDILVYVYNEYENPEGMVQIKVKGTNFTSKTDAYGFAKITNVPAGDYEVIAYRPKHGSGKNFVKVIPGNLNKLDVVYIEGLFYEPTIINQNPNLMNFSKNDTVIINFYVYDNETPSEVINVDFTVDQQIILSTHPEENGRLVFRSAELPNTSFILYIKATDADNAETIDSLFIDKTYPFKVKLDSPLVNNGRVILSWSASTDQDFSKYEIQRRDNYSSYGTLKVITNKETTTFTDSTTPYTGFLYYKIVTYNTEGKKSESNEVYVSNPNGETFYLYYMDALVHPGKPYIYLFDRDDDKVYQYNYETQKTIFQLDFNSNLSYPSIGVYNGQTELYVAYLDGTLEIYDENLSLIRIIYMSNYARSVVIDNNGFIYAATDNGMRVYSRSNGNLVNSYDYYDPSVKLQIDLSESEIFGLSSYYLDYYKINSSGQIITRKNISHYENDYIFHISPDSRYLAASNRGNIYSADSLLTLIGHLPSQSNNYRDCAISQDGNTIYAITANSSFKRISGYTYPGISFSSVLDTKGYPYKLFIKGNQMICVSQVPGNSYYYGVETFNIE